MNQNPKTIGIRGDNHARPWLTKNHLLQLETGIIEGLIDLGDVEATYIDIDNALRRGQDPTVESTMDAIIRNALDETGNLTEVGELAVEEDIRSITEMSKHNQEYANHFFRCINGNSHEVKTKIFDAIAPKKRPDLDKAFLGYEWIMKEADAEIIGNTALVYLPWKATIESIDQAFEKVGDVRKIVLLSHDYLTINSISKEFREKMKPMKNEEQVVRSLDLAAERSKKIEGYFGHIGLIYPEFQTKFSHRVPVTTFHVDEKNQTLKYMKVE